jgi:hypothetical protein
MTYSVLELETDLQNSFHGTTLNKVQGILPLINRAASELLMDLDPMETKRIVQLANPIFDKVYDYALPVDLKGTKIIDLRPQQNRNSQVYNQDFDINKDFVRQPNFSIQFNTGIKTIRIDNPLLTTGLTINECDSITNNGVWTVGGNASGLFEDNVQYISGGQSLAFTMPALGSTGYIENSTMTSLNLTDYGQGSLFFYVYLPDASDFTSIVVRIGSSSGNYYIATVTTTHEGTAFQDGWNLLRVDAINATGFTVFGTPDITKINYLRITFNYNGDIQQYVRLDNIVARIGLIIECEYYSKYIFRDVTTGAFKEKATTTTDLINLDTETRNILYYLCGWYAVQQIQGLDALFYDNNFFQQKFEEGLFRYKQTYKSEWQKPKSTYYKQPTATYRKWIGQRYNY